MTTNSKIVDRLLTRTNKVLLWILELQMCFLTIAFADKIMTSFIGAMLMFIITYGAELALLNSAVKNFILNGVDIDAVMKLLNSIEERVEEKDG